MTLTSKTMEWLNQNRRRSYPMRRDEWRMKVSPESGLDGVLLDALVFNNDASGKESLEFVSVSVGSASTIVVMRYSGSTFEVELSGGDVSGELSYDRRVMTVPGCGMRDASISLVFSSHAYLKNTIGECSFEIGAMVLESRVVSLTDGFGVDCIKTNGSACVQGHESPSDATGDVVLEDGFRTSPIIHNGMVRVRVGKKYGIDPCHYSCGGAGTTDCDTPLFFFCGQNAINGGNVVLTGGKGVTVKQGGVYKVKSGKRAGKSIPCIEIVAGPELMDIYKPAQSGSN